MKGRRRKDRELALGRLTACWREREGRQIGGSRLPLWGGQAGRPARPGLLATQVVGEGKKQSKHSRHFEALEALEALGESVTGFLASMEGRVV